MNAAVTHSREAETIEAKVRWFKSLTLEERMDNLCWYTDLAMAANPEVQEAGRAQPIAGRIQILSKT